MLTKGTSQTGRTELAPEPNMSLLEEKGSVSASVLLRKLRVCYAGILNGSSFILKLFFLKISSGVRSHHQRRSPWLSSELEKGWGCCKFGRRLWKSHRNNQHHSGLLSPFHLKVSKTSISSNYSHSTSWREIDIRIRLAGHSRFYICRLQVPFHYLL